MSVNAGFWRNIAILAGIALVIAIAPRGGELITVASATLSAAFLIAIAASLWRLYRSQSFWLQTLPDRNRAVLYAALSIATLDLVAKARFDAIAGGLVVWIAVLAGCGFAVYWVWQESRRYTL